MVFEIYENPKPFHQTRPAIIVGDYLNSQNTLDTGWAALGSVGSHISNTTSFDISNYGYKNLSTTEVVSNETNRSVIDDSDNVIFKNRDGFYHPAHFKDQLLLEKKGSSVVG